MNARGPFKFIKTNEYSEDIYEAKFELPNDGTPNSDRFLIIRVNVGVDENELSVFIESFDGRRHVISGFPSTTIISDLLYGATITRNIKKITPI